MLDYNLEELGPLARLQARRARREEADVVGDVEDVCLDIVAVGADGEACRVQVVAVDDVWVVEG